MYRPYIVAELNTSHFGNISIAKKMILKAKESGCDCVKLQSWKADTLYSKNFLDKNSISKKFFDKYSPSPIGAIFHDLDYYYSTINSFKIFDNDEK